MPAINYQTSFSDHLQCLFQEFIQEGGGDGSFGDLREGGREGGGHCSNFSMEEGIN